MLPGYFQACRQIHSRTSLDGSFAFKPASCENGATIRGIGAPHPRIRCRAGYRWPAMMAAMATGHDRGPAPLSQGITSEGVNNSYNKERPGRLSSSSSYGLMRCLSLLLPGPCPVRADAEGEAAGARRAAPLPAPAAPRPSPRLLRSHGALGLPFAVAFQRPRDLKRHVKSAGWSSFSCLRSARSCASAPAARAESQRWTRR